MHTLNEHVTQLHYNVTDLQQHNMPFKYRNSKQDHNSEQDIIRAISNPILVLCQYFIRNDGGTIWW